MRPRFASTSAWSWTSGEPRRSDGTGLVSGGRRVYPAGLACGPVACWGWDVVQQGLRSTLWAGAALTAMALAVVGCGSAASVKIPSPTPSARPSTTPLAPGVRVPVTEVSPPQYTVSASHPLPSGVSAAQVAKDVEIDNLIENIAIEKGDPALLAYADCGAWLQSERATIQTNRSNALTITGLADKFTSVQVGYQPDPNDASAVASVILVGVETETIRNSSSTTHTVATPFSAMRWLVWTPTHGRYLTCDLASS